MGSIVKRLLRFARNDTGGGNPLFQNSLKAKKIKEFKLKTFDRAVDQ
jgi:hypothetical protein